VTINGIIIKFALSTVHFLEKRNSVFWKVTICPRVANDFTFDVTTDYSNSSIAQL